jgi:hypothetical protein
MSSIWHLGSKNKTRSSIDIIVNTEPFKIKARRLLSINEAGPTIISLTQMNATRPI